VKEDKKMANDILQKFSKFDNIIAKADQLSYLEDVLKRIKAQNKSDLTEVEHASEEQGQGLAAENELEANACEETNDFLTEGVEEAETTTCPETTVSNSEEAVITLENNISKDTDARAEARDSDIKEGLLGNEDWSCVHVNAPKMKTFFCRRPGLYMQPSKFLIISWLKALRT
jgi:hypothetical protein